MILIRIVTSRHDYERGVWGGGTLRYFKKSQIDNVLFAWVCVFSGKITLLTHASMSEHSVGFTDNKLTTRDVKKGNCQRSSLRRKTDLKRYIYF